MVKLRVMVDDISLQLVSTRRLGIPMMVCALSWAMGAITNTLRLPLSLGARGKCVILASWKAVAEELQRGLREEGFTLPVKRAVTQLEVDYTSGGARATGTASRVPSAILSADARWGRAPSRW